MSSDLRHGHCAAHTTQLPPLYSFSPFTLVKGSSCIHSQPPPSLPLLQFGTRHVIVIACLCFLRTFNPGQTHGSLDPPSDPWPESSKGFFLSPTERSQKSHSCGHCAFSTGMTTYLLRSTTHLAPEGFEWNLLSFQMFNFCYEYN